MPDESIDAILRRAEALVAQLPCTLSLGDPYG